MLRWLNSGGVSSPKKEGVQYDEFKGNIIVVDLSTIDGRTEKFEGCEWLEEKINNQEPVGWDLEWQPDRTKEADNPIALMQFADETTALLLRTHRTKSWLPVIVCKALLSTGCKKIGVGWDGPDKMKMELTFHFQPIGIVDLAELAKKKGLSELGLKSLSEKFGYRMRKDTRVARSNWAQAELTEEQKQYAAEDAHFTYLLYQKINALEDKKIDEEAQAGHDRINQGVLKIEEGWEEQGIERRGDGLYCSMCSQGPMNVPMVVHQHIAGKKHRQRLDARNGVTKAENLPEEYIGQGIFAGDGVSGKVGTFKCGICDKGPFNSVEAVKPHLESKDHIAKFNKASGIGHIAEVNPHDPFVDGLWNMPDYVAQEDDAKGTKFLKCNMCAVKATCLLQMRNHLNSNNHNKKCRGEQKPELIFVVERAYVEYMQTGKPVVRTGFTAPRLKKQVSAAASSSGTAARSSGSTSAPVESSDPLPEGWEEFLDKKHNKYYYYCEKTETTTWNRPAAASPVAAEVAPLNLQRQPATSNASTAHHAGTDASATSATIAPDSGSAAQAATIAATATAYLARTAVAGLNAGTATPAAASTCQPQPEMQSHCQPQSIQQPLRERVQNQNFDQQVHSKADQPAELLPLGWDKIWSKEQGRYYYADRVRNVSSWELPPADVKHDWHRYVSDHHPELGAYWACEVQSLTFWESDPQWKRLCDQHGGVFWTCAETGLRFRETEENR